METQFKDVAHLYLGCKIQIGSEIHSYTTIEDFGSGKENEFKVFVQRGTYTVFSTLDWKHIKPILRPLSSMTEEEKIWIVKGITFNHMKFSDKASVLSYYEPERYAQKHNNEFYAEEFAYLLSRNFDLFSLIESGQAIDATTMTPNPYQQ